MKKITLFSDGSALSNPGPGGYGVVLRYGDSERELSRAYEHTTNNWIKKDFKKVKNPDLWRDYIEVLKPHTIHAIWVRGHDGHIENERCDKLARDEAEKMKASL